MASDLDNLLVSQATLASYLGVVPNTVSRLASECGMPKHARGQYPLGRCITWYLRRLADRAAANPSDLADERRKLIQAQRIGQELDNAANRAAMLDAGLVSASLHEMVSRITSHLDSLPLLAGELATLRDPTAISRVLWEGCRQVRVRAAEDMRDFAASLADGPDA